MKLNLDCMRDVLLVLEAAPFQKAMNLGEITGALAPKYSFEDIAYSVQKLGEAEYIVVKSKSYVTGSTIISIKDITFEGHQFLADIRSNTLWEKVKEKAAKIGTDSIPSILKIALQVASQAISEQITK